MMGNKNILNYYDGLAKKITDPKQTRNKAKDFSLYDIQLMKSLSGSEKTLLDLGSGTGLLINHLVDDFKSITAVEKYKEFSKFIVDSKKIKVINQDLLQLNLPNDTKYDIISLFGVMNFFDINEAKHIYSKIFKLLKTDGILVVKNQFGINNDVIVNGFSEELQTNYYSEYRFLNKEKELLKSCGFNSIKVMDIYPPEYNRWANTHFYALICSVDN